MNIIDTLSRDMGEILQLELTKPRFNKDQLCVYLWLLIGHRRHVRNSFKSASSVEVIETEDLVDDEGLEESDEANFEAENKVVQMEAFKALQQQLKTFRYANPYINKLLFRDFQNQEESQYEQLPCLKFGTVFIHQEAVRYVSEVLLLRPLQLARKIGDEPTNMHLLLKTLCRISQADGHWSDTDIARSHTAITRTAAWFDKLAKKLQIHHEQQGDNISTTAFNRREKSGSYWLTAGECSEKISEELSLQNVLEMTPVPLKPGFSNNPEFSAILKSTIDSLNMRYRCLRSAGLPPEDWLQKDKPSIEELKKLARLRKRAASSQEWIDYNIEAAFEKAFYEELEAIKSKRQGKNIEADSKIAGFADFYEFKNSSIGDVFIHRNMNRMHSLNELLDADMGDFDLEDTDMDTALSVESSLGINTLLEEAGTRLSEKPVLVEFFHQVLLADRVLFGINGLLEDKYFLDLLINEPKYVEFVTAVLALSEKSRSLSLSELEQEDLQEELNSVQTQIAEKLFFETRQLLFEIIVERKAINITPLLHEFICQVSILEKPARGKDGLFNKKSFKKLLAENEQLTALTPEQLLIELEQQAQKILTSLFNQDV